MSKMHACFIYMYNNTGGTFVIAETNVGTYYDMAGPTVCWSAGPMVR